MKAADLFKQYIWLTDTIYRAGKITLQELNELWLKTDMSGGIPMTRFYFNRHRIAIEDIFGINIECHRKGGYEYCIENEEVLRGNTLQRWMLDALSMGNILAGSTSLKEHILLENIPSGNMVSLKETTEPFVMPENFSAENIFKDCYGIICGTQTKAERIRIRAYYPLVNYLRTLPWHASQKEVHTTDEYSEFEFFLRPTFDFRQEILSQGNEVEVLEPASFRQEVMEALQSAMRRYQP